MSRSKSLMFGLAVVMGMVAGSACAQEEAAAAGDEKPWSIEAGADFNSKYVWRGILVTDDPVLQPWITFAFKGFSFNIWANMDLTDVNGNNDEINEVDYTLDYSGEAGPVGYSVGVIHYDFPNTDFAATTEVYAGIGLDVPLSPTLTVYRDVDEVDGFYVTFDVSHSFENVVNFSETASMGIDLGAQISWGDDDYNMGYFGVDSNGFNALTLTAGLPIAIGDHLSITPGVNYSYLIDSDIRDAVDEEDNFWAGVSVGLAF